MSTPDIYINKEGTICANIRYPKPEPISRESSNSILTWHVGKVLTRHHNNTVQILSAAATIAQPTPIHIEMPPMPVAPPLLSSNPRLQAILNEPRPSSNFSLNQILASAKIETHTRPARYFSEKELEPERILDSSMLSGKLLFLKCFLEDDSEKMSCERVEGPEVNPCLFSSEAVVSATMKAALRGFLTGGAVSRTIPGAVVGAVTEGIIELIVEYSDEIKRVGECEKQENENARP